jgi:hypothetical protein
MKISKIIELIFGNKKEPVKQSSLRSITIKKTGIFNKYEVTKLKYYGLQGFIKYETDICVGIATISTPFGFEMITESNITPVCLPSNYKLIKLHFIKDETGEYQV